jgi:arylsulfatase
MPAIDSARPNILWIMTDQFNAQCLSIAGHPHVRTPNLDRLARAGVRFTEAHCQYPQCTPSRTSMLLGQYCKTHRMYGFVGNMDASGNLFDHFGGHGYRTGAFGKLHIDPMGRTFNPDRCSPSMGTDWFLAKPEGRHYGSYLEQHGLTYPTHETHGVPGQTPPQPSPWTTDIPEEHNLEKWTADETIDFMRETRQRGDAPFLAFMSFERPHKPIFVPEGRIHQIDPGAITLDEAETAAQLLLKPRIALEGRIDSCSDTWQVPEDFRQLLACYYIVIEMIDEQIGRVLEELEALGIAENTAIAFCADHGDMAGRRRIFDKCLHTSSVELTRVPMILCPAGTLRSDEPAGPPRVCESPVESIDLFPTFCDWAGIATPDRVEGVNLSDVVSGEVEADVSRAAVTESYYRRSIVKDGYRFVFHHGGSVHELYDLKRDPREYDNLYLQPGHTRVIDDMKHELIRFLSEPFNEADSRFADDELLGNVVNRRKLKHQALHRSGCESGPFFVEGRAVHVLEYKHWTLLYRVDTRDHHVYANSDADRENNLMAGAMGRYVYGELRDVLLSMLMQRCVPRTYWEPQPLGAEMPSPDQVDAYLSQPLMQSP